MKLDLSKYSGWYYTTDKNIERTGLTDVIVLVRPEWWIPNKVIKYDQMERDCPKTKLTYYNHSSSFLEMKEYLNNYFQLGIDKIT